MTLLVQIPTVVRGKPKSIRPWHSYRWARRKMQKGHHRLRKAALQKAKS